MKSLSNDIKPRGCQRCAHGPLGVTLAKSRFDKIQFTGHATQFQKIMVNITLDIFSQQLSCCTLIWKTWQGWYALLT